MVIFVWPDGVWAYDWEVDYYGHKRLVKKHKQVDLDRWYEYTLSDTERDACLRAVEAAQKRIDELFGRSNG